MLFEGDVVIRIRNFTTGASYGQAISKDAWSQVTNETFSSGMQGIHEGYMSTGQPKVRRWTTSTSAARDRHDYTYDSFGNLVSQSRQIGGVPSGGESYQYDALQRLTMATRVGVPGSPPPITYGYPANGNLDRKSDVSTNAPGAYGYGANGCGPHGVSSIVTSTGIQSFQCDANGNRIEDPDQYLPHYCLACSRPQASSASSSTCCAADAVERNVPIVAK